MSLEKLLNREVEDVGTNRIVYKLDDPISRGVSLVGSLPTRAILLSWDVCNLPREYTQEEVKDYVTRSGLENTTVRMGHTSIIKDTLRLFYDKKLKGVSYLGRIIFGLPTTVIGGLYSKLTRSNHYNPFTRTAHIYADVLAVALHELGHAKDFQNRKYPTLYALARAIPFFPLYQEFKASKIADKALPESEKGQTGRYLFPAFATYGSNAFVLPLIPAVAAGHIIGNLYRATRYIANKIKSYFKNPRR
ncbi:hypothetical protein ES703_03000 [subsurface metagenome]